MLFTALVVVAMAAALALASRAGARRPSSFATLCALAATAAITLQASRAPLVRNLTDLPGATTLLIWLLAYRKASQTDRRAASERHREQVPRNTRL